MDKYIYLLRGEDEETYTGFNTRITAAVSKLVHELNPAAVKYTLTEKAPPRLSLIPFSRKKIAAISIQGLKPGVDWIRGEPGFCGSYRVQEARPVAYRVTWQPGEPTPGACLFTLFSKKKGIDYPTFIHRWHHIHTPHSLQIHPLWNYVRNVVQEKLFAESEWFDGIVEEQVRRESDLLNPFRFWGNPLVILPRMLKELYDTTSFIDYGTMEVYLGTEYIVKTPGSKS